MNKSYPWVRIKSIPVGNFLQSPGNEKSGMEKIYEQRRLQLIAFLDTLGRGGIAKVAKEAGIDASYLSRCRYPADKVGHKNIGDEIVTKLDLKFPQWRESQGVKSPEFSSSRSRRIDEIVSILKTIDDDGLLVVLGEVRIASKQFPIAKQTLESSN